MLNLLFFSTPSGEATVPLTYWWHVLRIHRHIVPKQNDCLLSDTPVDASYQCPELIRVFLGNRPEFGESIPMFLVFRLEFGLGIFQLDTHMS